MCVTQLVNSENLGKLTGNPTSQEAWLRKHVLELVRDYPVLLDMALNASQPLTYSIASGDDTGTYVIRNGLPAHLRKKLETLHRKAWELTQEIEDLPKSGRAVSVSAVVQEGVDGRGNKRSARSATL